VWTQGRSRKERRVQASIDAPKPKLRRWKPSALSSTLRSIGSISRHRRATADLHFLLRAALQTPAVVLFVVCGSELSGFVWADLGLGLRPTSIHCAPSVQIIFSSFIAPSRCMFWTPEALECACSFHINPRCRRCYSLQPLCPLPQSGSRSRRWSMTPVMPRLSTPPQVNSSVQKRRTETTWKLLMYRHTIRLSSL
jgi:hypothetical protein